MRRADFDVRKHDKNEVAMIYDCFTFFNELDLLEIRLNDVCDIYG